MGHLNKQEKQNLIIKLLNEGHTYRQIQKIAHVTPNFISQIEKEEFGMQNIITNSTTGLSKNSKAIQLFCNNKKPIEVALELNMHANDVNKAYLDFMRLSGLDRFTDLIMDENKQKLILMLKVIDTFNKNGIKNIKIKEDWLRFLKSKQDELKKEIYKKEERLGELQRLSKDIYDMEAFEH